MDDESFQGARFRRGGDRRKQSLPVAHDRRRPSTERRRGLGALPLFQNADEAALIDAVGDSSVAELAAGSTLLTPGDDNDTVYIVLSGRLGVYIDPAGGADSAIPVLPGECLGELSVIDGKPVSALVKTIDDSRVLALNHDVFWNRLMAVPGVARNLLAVLADRMRRNLDAMLEGQRRRIELQHLRQELDLARQLQTGMLPLRRPLFPDRGDIEIAGIMEPASAVGGDLFDAFFVDDHRLFFCIGDVSGHGIPAAMFMARAVSLMRLEAINTRQPARLLARINQQLCVGNEVNMFVSLLCGFLDLDTGHLVYSNGGHLPPFLCRGGGVSPLPLPPGMILGIMDDADYVQAELVLAPGDRVVCHTDGVTEAHSPAGEEFGEDRLRDLLAGKAALAAEALLDEVRAAVGEFSGTPELEDDCTLLAIGLPARRGAEG